MKVTLEVKKASVLLTEGTDVVSLHLDMPTPFPEMNYEGTFCLNARRNFGVQWVKEILGMEPEVINCRHECSALKLPKKTN